MTDSKPERTDGPSDHPAAAVNTVVLIGHCGFDEVLLFHAVRSALPDIRIESAPNTTSLAAYLVPGALLLINRVLDGRFATHLGIDLIAELVNQDTPPCMMLISDYPDAQALAVEAGALPGFGKRELRSTETADKLRAAAGQTGA